MLLRLRCLFGRHEPDRRKAHPDGQQLHAPCRGCGIEMVRNFEGWVPASEARPNPLRLQRPGDADGDQP